jgi:ABC-type molybdate transport system permease subunit
MSAAEFEVIWLTLKTAFTSTVLSMPIAPTLTLGGQNMSEIGEKANDFVTAFPKTKKTC